MRILIKKFIKFLKFLKNEKYNIGFVDCSPEDIMSFSEGSSTYKFKNIRWLKNPSFKTWYADPFIYRVTDSTITVFVEEQIFEKPGQLVSLDIDRATMRIIQKRILLQLETHLSYPQIITDGNNLHVCPESSQSGHIALYELDNNQKLHFNTNLIDGAYVDSSIIHYAPSDVWYMCATDLNNKSFLFKSSQLQGGWSKVSDVPICDDVRFSRCGGGFFEYKTKYFRVAQDCKNIYGNSIHVMRINTFEPYSETEILHIKPSSYRYNVGLHTLTFHNSGISVIDGKGYTFGFIGQILASFLNPLFVKVQSKLNIM